MDYKYRPAGVCAKEINFSLEDGKVKNVSFVGGCNGNLKAISSIVEGMDVDFVIERFKGIRCGMKKTSCSDQFARALEAAKENN
ncbi:MAG: TIGR03905 family TSCPD domain-containing protein [Firmicutes bacterium]|nr:TIGR03905 family TSCPD domain-containing protein [Bacillota bacterium]